MCLFSLGNEEKRYQKKAEYRSVTVFPPFEPYPANDALMSTNNVWTHRPSNAGPDPIITCQQILSVVNLNSSAKKYHQNKR